MESQHWITIAAGLISASMVVLATLSYRSRSQMDVIEALRTRLNEVLAELAAVRRELVDAKQRFAFSEHEVRRFREENVDLMRRLLGTDSQNRPSWPRDHDDKGEE